MYIMYCCDLIFHFMALWHDTPEEALLDGFTEGVGLKMKAHSYRIESEKVEGEFRKLATEQ